MCSTNRVRSYESCYMTPYFCIIDAYKPIDLMQLVVNQIFCDEIFDVIIGVRAGGAGGAAAPPPPKFWATQIFWAAREIWAKQE